MEMTRYGGFGGWQHGHDGRFAEQLASSPCSLDQHKCFFTVSQKFGALRTTDDPLNFSLGGLASLVK